MTITEIEHNIFERMVKNNDFKNNVEANQNAFKSGLLQILVNSSKKIDSNFILELLKLADNDFYILPLGKTIQLFTKDFKGTIAFNLRRPNENHAECFNVPLMIEVDALHSNKKGHGKQLMNSVIKIADTINVPVCLWTETQKNTRYFKKYTFKTYGKRGERNEELLIRKRVPFR
ncbi:hypothetical protein AST00_01875 [Staphylococcus equorum]|uniref:hypothetical protein n=1 Tax=Staphylococcus equorum TaxID=246432 RepID=UPI000852EDBC|nr:hypothetical protein [Staphylococcus equorum]OEK71030.1 hypothetical protein AST00_01875 [Staphylococcus equorum]